MQNQEKNNAQRPAGVPDDYAPIAIMPKNGEPIIFWGRVVKTSISNGSEKLSIEGIVPEG